MTEFMQSISFPALKLIVYLTVISGLSFSTAVCDAAYPARQMWMFFGSGSAWGPGTFDGSTYYNQGGYALNIFDYEDAGAACAAASAYNNQPYSGVYEIVAPGGAAKCLRPDGQWWVSISRLPICHEGPNSSGETSVYFAYEPCNGTPLCPTGQLFSFSEGLCEFESSIAADNSRNSGGRCPATNQPISLGSGNKFLRHDDGLNGTVRETLI